MMNARWWMSLSNGISPSILFFTLLLPSLLRAEAERVPHRCCLLHGTRALWQARKARYIFQVDTSSWGERRYVAKARALEHGRDRHQVARPRQVRLDH